CCYSNDTFIGTISTWRCMFQFLSTPNNIHNYDISLSEKSHIYSLTELHVSGFWSKREGVCVCVCVCVSVCVCVAESENGSGMKCQTFMSGFCKSFNCKQTTNKKAAERDTN